MMAAQRAPNTEPLPGYRLLEPLGRGGFGEVWKCEAPGGLHKAIKFVRGQQDTVALVPDGAAQELRALQLIRSIRHPFLLSTERVEVINGDLIIVMELADRSLHDLLVEHQKAQQPGIPRNVLLAYLREVAEVLDLMNLEHGLQHLDIKPRNLFVVGRHIKVADFGLVNSLADLTAAQGEGTQLDAITPLYAAPEVFQGRVTLYTDQYSLAVTYHELLTGTYPFTGKDSRQLALQHTHSSPQLRHLPSSDQAILARALAREPADRFPSCSEFIEALAAQSATTSTPTPPVHQTMDALSLSSMITTERAAAGGLEETRQVETASMQATPAAAPATGQSQGSGILPGYQFLECHSRSPAGEVWRAQCPQGNPCLIRIVTQTEADSSSEQVPGGDPFERLRALRHPLLAEIDVQLIGPGRVAVITESGDLHLGERLKACKLRGQSGIPRRELLSYLRRVAQGLDELYQAEGFCHLTLSPRQVVLTRRPGLSEETEQHEVSLLDFGLAELFWIPGRVSLGSINPRYAPVEVFQGVVSGTSDQYSLALIYQEMLLGLHPFRNLNARQLASPRMRGQPEFGLLPAAERAVLTRALNLNPEKRFESCLELMLALEEAAQAEILAGSANEPAARPGNEPTRTPARTMVVPSLAALGMTMPTPVKGRPGLTAAQEWVQPLNELLAALARGHQVLSQGNLWYQSQGGMRLEHRCHARLVPGTARLKLEGFRQQWNAAEVSRNDSVTVYSIRTPATFFQRLLGRRPSLDVVVQLGTSADSQRVPVLVMIRPVNCSNARATALLKEVGPEVLASLQVYLQSNSQKEDQERYPYQDPLVLWPVGGDGRLGRSVRARARDLGRQGITVFSQEPVDSDLVDVQLNRLNSEDTLRVPGQVRSRQPVGDGQTELHIDFTQR